MPFIPHWMLWLHPDLVDAFRSGRTRQIQKTFEAGSALQVSAFQIALASGSLLGGLAVDNAGMISAMALGGALCLVGAIVVWRFDSRESIMRAASSRPNRRDRPEAL